MPDNNKCPQCGTPLPAGALAGLCPACLLKAGAAADSITEGKQPAFNPPGVAELAAKFPQLEIIELIGKGGMGAVYKARQRQLDRLVALKILPPGIGGDPAFAERFAREAKALAKLNHPGIVTIYDFGRADGLFYFFMEFVDGVNLRQLLQNGRLSTREALAIVPQICDALQYAHDQGIVHRDIKPENILLDRRGRVKVADFGLAKIIGGETGAGSPARPTTEAGAPSAALTESGKIMGTPHYMAPEQQEHPESVDHRADIYALGVVFYQMLTGELPGRRLEPPSSKVQIDVRLDEVVLRALERKPELRYQQASVLKTQVETIAQTAAPQPTPAAGSTPARGARGWLLVLGIGLGLGVGVVLIAMLGLMAAVAIPNFVRARQHAQQQAAQSWTQQGWTLWQAGKLAEAQAQFQKAVELRPEDADAWNGLGWAQFNSGNGAAAEASFLRAVGIDTNQPGALNGLGQLYLRQANYDQAERFLLRAAPQAPAAWYGLARVYLLEGKYAQAEKWARQIVDSGQADDTARKMLQAAEAEKLPDGLRALIAPPAAGPAPSARPPNSTSTATNPAAGLPTGQTEPWSPAGENGQPLAFQKVLSAAKSLTDEGSYEEALQRYLWYFEHSRNDPAQKGVRLSFALSDWVALGDRYPKAKQALVDIRDADARELATNGPSFELFQEISSINQYLKRDEDTLALFEMIEKQQPTNAPRYYPLVQGLLLQHPTAQRGRYQQFLAYIGDPQAAFDRLRESREHLKDLEAHQAEQQARMRQHMASMASNNPVFSRMQPPLLQPPLLPPPFVDKYFVEQTRELIEILVGAGQKAKAEDIRRQALAVLDDEHLKTAVTDAERETGAQNAPHN